jgi:UDP-hydrolysing UDP-N-acetyl-D-glucosamine 2-epimerase
MAASRHIGVVTSGRSDFGLLLPLMRAIGRDTSLQLTVYATGMHFSKKRGSTIDEVRANEIADQLVEVPSGETDDSAAGVAGAIARGVEGFTQVFGKRPPDVLVVMGDRFDALPAALAALPFNLPVAHISGGELTEGVIDDPIRHAMTKLSHIHFPAHETAARRIIQMGEDPWRVTAVGEPGLDALEDFAFEDLNTVFEGLDLERGRRVTVFTHHPETLAATIGSRDMENILAAGDGIDSQIVFTYPNIDTGSGAIIDAIETFCQGRAGCSVHVSLGHDGYLNLLRHADCMVGNSSSGIVEAAWFELPVVNIGDRQRGRVMPDNVINVAPETEAVAEAWAKALDPDFRKTLSGLKNPYGDGHASDRIVQCLKSIDLDRKLIAKRFRDLPGPEQANPIAPEPQDHLKTLS